MNQKSSSFRGEPDKLGLYPALSEDLRTTKLICIGGLAIQSMYVHLTPSDDPQKPYVNLRPVADIERATLLGARGYDHSAAVVVPVPDPDLLEGQLGSADGIAIELGCLIGTVDEVVEKIRQGLLRAANLLMAQNSPLGREQQDILHPRIVEQLEKLGLSGTGAQEAKFLPEVPAT